MNIHDILTIARFLAYKEAQTSGLCFNSRISEINTRLITQKTRTVSIPGIHAHIFYKSAYEAGYNSKKMVHVVSIQK
jgi:hypothetical protein